MKPRGEGLLFFALYFFLIYSTIAWWVGTVTMAKGVIPVCKAFGLSWINLMHVLASRIS